MKRVPGVLLFCMMAMCALVLGACGKKAAESATGGAAAGSATPSLAAAPSAADSAAAEEAGPEGAAGPAAAKTARSEAPGRVAGDLGEQAPRPEPGLLTAADIDDNLNYDFFLKYLGRAREAAPELPAVDLSGRVTMRVRGVSGEPAPNACVQIWPTGTSSSSVSGYAGSDGTYYFYPGMDGMSGQRAFTVTVSPAGSEFLNETRPTASTQFSLDELGPDRVVECRPIASPTAAPDALDLMFVVDTTGSMGDELQYITTELEGIVSRVKGRFPDVAMRFGLVVYRDEGDEYVVKTFDFTDSVETMREQLAAQSANGGGDYPEAVEQALGSAVDRDWRGGETAKLLFHIADAPPHDQKLEAMLERVKSFRRLGIHVYPIGASGVADTAEYMMRVAAATTHGRYLWLTDDSGIGLSHAEPKVPGYVVTKLKDLIFRVIASELAGERVEPAEEEILRTVGRCDRGVCQADEQQ